MPSGDDKTAACQPNQKVPPIVESVPWFVSLPFKIAWGSDFRQQKGQQGQYTVRPTYVNEFAD
jgi:hypothetical protein